MTDSDTEEPLTGGNASSDVVRIGDTVRKPWLPSTENTVAFMQALRACGIDVPEPLGRDDSARQIIEYIPGELAIDQEPLSAELLRRVGTLVRSIHDASAGLALPDDWDVLIPPEQPDLVCHNDLASWNLVVYGDRLVFIDWDGAGPSTRLWDLAYAALSFGHLTPTEKPERAVLRLTAFLDGYDADSQLRADLTTAMTRRARAMHDLLRRSHAAGVQPWASMYVQGHGVHWQGVADYVADHENAWRDAINS